MSPRRTASPSSTWAASAPSRISIAAAAWYFVARRAGLSDPEMDDFLRGLTDEEQKQALERANRLR